MDICLSESVGLMELKVLICQFVLVAKCYYLDIYLSTGVDMQSNDYIQQSPEK